MAAAQALIARLPPAPGCVVTADALHANQPTMEQLVVEKSMDYLIQVKGNAPALRAALVTCLERRPAANGHAQTVDGGHGRIEVRALELTAITPLDTHWPHTFTAIRVTRDRQQVRRGETVSQSVEEACYVASFAATTYPAAAVLHRIRSHWSIENGLHHRKDRSMDEDRNRAAAHGSGRVMCAIRSLTALFLGRARESFSVVQRRLCRRPHLLLGLLASHGRADWEQTWHPYRLG